MTLTDPRDILADQSFSGRCSIFSEGSRLDVLELRGFAPASGDRGDLLVSQFTLVLRRLDGLQASESWGVGSVLASFSSFFGLVIIAPPHKRVLTISRSSDSVVPTDRPQRTVASS